MSELDSSPLLLPQFNCYYVHISYSIRRSTSEIQRKLFGVWVNNAEEVLNIVETVSNV
jgi:hypothetical protein